MNENKHVSLPFFGLGKILPFLKPYKGMLILMIFALILTAAIDIALPLFQRYAIENFIEADTTDGLWIYAAVYLMVILLQSGCTFVWLRISSITEMYIGRDMKRQSFNHLQTLSLPYFNTNSVGYIHARVMSDTGRIGLLASWGTVDGVWAVAYLIGAFGVMLWLDWLLALIILAVIPPVALLASYFQRRLIRTHRRVREVNSIITGKFNEGITGAKTTKTLVSEEIMSDDFRSSTSEMRRVSVRAARFRSAFIASVSFFSSFAIAIMLWYGGERTSNELMLVGTLSAFTTYAIAMIDPIQSLARVITDLITVQANIERFSRLMATEPIVRDTPEVIEKYGDAFNPKKENWEELKGDIEFCDVSFKYPDGNSYILEHFNLKIPAGTNVAIVGETGAGKSTLVNLACRFYEPTSGRILIDGRDYRERSQLWLHSNIGYVLQSPHLFSGTVLDNLRYGRLDATMEEVEAAVRTVSAEGVIEKLDNGYMSDVGEGGDMLSTGEKQLISFARAILADPRIFVLDEATSSIDTITEQLIQNAIEKTLHGRTSFLIAHRLSTIRRADLILVVRDGKIIEQGTHDELMAKRGYYFDLYSRQYEQESVERAFGGGGVNG